MEQIKKILIVTPFAGHKGGVESINFLLYNLFVKNHFQVDYLTADDDTNRFILGKKIFGLPWVTAKKFRNLKEKYDLIICNGEFGFKINHPNAINVFHGSYSGFRDAIKRYLGPIPYLKLSWLAKIQQLAAKNKTVVSVSPYLKKILQQQHIKTDFVIENSINTDLFCPNANSKKSKKLLFVGNYNYYGKGFDILQKIKSEGFELDCLSDAPNDLGLMILPPQHSETLPSLYNQYEILVFPSRFESSGLVPLEAMSCGIPVIMNNVGIAPQLKNAIPEFVLDFTQDDYMELFKQRVQLLRNNWNHFSNLAREYVLKNHSLEKFNGQWMNLIEVVTDARF